MNQTHQNHQYYLFFYTLLLFNLLPNRNVGLVNGLPKTNPYLYLFFVENACVLILTNIEFSQITNNFKPMLFFILFMVNSWLAFVKLTGESNNYSWCIKWT